MEQRIGAVTGQRFVAHWRQPLGGGCINQAWQKVGDGERDFSSRPIASPLPRPCSRRRPPLWPELGATGAVRVPLPVEHGTAAGLAFLVLEYLPLGGGGTRALEILGRRLAALPHSPTVFGWYQDNTIGSTPSPI
ncbi:MAG: fructosamine kinase family protein [Candidatus Competibacteraceae bacterium]